jgi:hypothetical protein
MHITYLFQNKFIYRSWAAVVLACDPSYSGGRDQEDHGSRPVQAKKI